MQGGLGIVGKFLAALDQATHFRCDGRGWHIGPTERRADATDLVYPPSTHASRKGVYQRLQPIDLFPPQNSLRMFSRSAGKRKSDSIAARILGLLFGSTRQPKRGAEVVPVVYECDACRQRSIFSQCHIVVPIYFRYSWVRGHSLP